MRIAHAFLAASLPLTLALAQPALAESTKTLHLEMDPGSGFAVENLAGTMTIGPGNGSKVAATATVHAEDDSLMDSVRFEQVRGKNGRPTMRVVYPVGEHSTFRYTGGGSDGGSFLGRLFGGNSSTSTTYDGERVKVSSNRGVLLYADVEVRLPSGGVDGFFRNVMGKVLARDVEGTLSFDSGSGDIAIENVSGMISADTGSGEVKAERINGSFKGDTGSGDIHVVDFHGEAINCDTGSGDVRIESARARLIEADTGSGDIRVEDSETREFEADTGSGDVYLETEGSLLENVSADTGSGDVVLVLGPDASFEARGDIGSGDIISHYSDAEAIVHRREVIGYRRGDARTRIRVDTGSGDFVIKPGR
ncbi:MAG: DUF4097 domain-containing protein [Acidobacteriota bacterium]